MFEKLIKAAHSLDNRDSLPDIPEPLSRGGLMPNLMSSVKNAHANGKCLAVPDEVSIDNLESLITETQDGGDETAILWAIYASLISAKKNIKDGDENNRRTTLAKIALRTGQMMEPVCTGATFDEDSTDYASLAHNGLLGLHILDQIAEFSSPDGPLLPARALISVIAYTNPDDLWTTASSAKLSGSLLSKYFQDASPQSVVKPTLTSLPPSVRSTTTSTAAGGHTRKIEVEHFITEDIITGFLRPIFAKSRPTAVTSSGRPAAFPEPAPRYGQGDGFGAGTDDVTATKPWKYARQYAVTVFEWAVKNADTDLLQQHWPLYTPILLTLLDEPQPTSLKLRSLSIFRDFWARCPDGLLARTGLADVFEQAVFPAVLSLPSLTPETESLALLGAAYPALFSMAGLETTASHSMSITGTVSDATDDDDNEKDREGLHVDDKREDDKLELRSKDFSEMQRKLLDKIIREGIMVGYHHANEHIRLVDFLCQTLCRIVNGIGILSVKYLKDIISMISEILIDPFGTKYPPTLLSAIYLLQAVLRSCWPRMPHYCNEINKIATLAWLHIEDEESFPSGKPTESELQQQLIRAVEMLSAIMKSAKIDIADRVGPLVAKEPQLRPLFQSCEAN
ncbi:hypothetical protein F5Y19DRAFT_491850 [Xylariaceae sp. FL1651]|nr:hypothetical protein F5Y19DRAFT_491850 [Xylariaceae sp. FL1651]